MTVTRFKVIIEYQTTVDYEDYKRVMDAIKMIGYKIIIADNGDTVCEKIEEDIIRSEVRRENDV